MFCSNCGENIPDNSKWCPKCGHATQISSASVPVKLDEPNILLNIVSFLCPLAGWIIYFVKRGETPNKAQACCRWAWIGFAVNILLSFIGMAA